ncbi:hypothetical protein Syun_004791 [Stephania yunnanensis]|uniref:Fe2OG dioxygenase domain-containing protein n=1 Tax=Stephania yunnanensis TaxID=152371 RepID=A0AAP0L7U3_9MAGN
MGSVKALIESTTLTSIPPNYAYNTTSNTCNQQNAIDPVELEGQIPTIDYSMLVSGSGQQRSQCVQQVGEACRDWGFFYVINHGVPGEVMERMLGACGDFFDLREEEKREMEGEEVLDPIRCGTSFNAAVEQVFFWRDFLKVFVHPIFHSPDKPPGFSDISLNYSKKVRAVMLELLGAISESLGVDKCYIEKEMELEHGLQILAANLYPPCPQPELAMGMPPHSDHGLLTLLIENQGHGLQIHHNGMWIHVNNAPPSSFLVNIADHLEILSNGKYKSVVHRAVVNNKAARISVAMAHGPALDKVVEPAPELVKNGGYKAKYIGMKYKDYLASQQGSQLNGKSCLERLRIECEPSTK